MGEPSAGPFKSEAEDSRVGPKMDSALGLIIIPGRAAFLEGVEPESRRLIRADDFHRTVRLDIGFSAGTPIAGVDE